jgi:hypothetical protein
VPVTDPGAWGVSTGYHAYNGEWQESPPETVEAVLAAMGAGPEGPPPASFITVRTDRPLPRLGRGTLLLEDGGEADVDGPLLDVPHGYHRFVAQTGETTQVVVSPGVVPARSAHGDAATSRTWPSWAPGPAVSVPGSPSSTPCTRRPRPCPSSRVPITPGAGAS